MGPAGVQVNAPPKAAGVHASGWRLAGRARDFERDNRPLLLVVGGYIAAALVAGSLLDRGFGLDPAMLTVAAALTLSLASAYAAAYAIRVKFTRRYGPGGLLRAEAWREFAGADAKGHWLGGLVILLILLGPFLDAFLYFKRLIPVIQPFSWDRRIADWDRLLHMGHEPWSLLQGWLGQPVVTNAIDVVYHSWFPLGLLLVAWQAVSARRQLRMQFLLSYVFVWIILGNGAATLLSSAGPCYYGLVTGDAARFAPLFLYLAQVHESHGLAALHSQPFLWAGYAGRISLDLGISAMPSIHVALAVLYAILGWRTERWLGAALTAFALIILVGSVHLGWHYALDGYVSIVATPLLWVGTGRALRWYEGRGGRARTEADAGAAGAAGAPAPPG